VGFFYSISKHILLHSHNTKYHYLVSLLLYLQTQSAPFTQHKISLECLAIIVPPNKLCSFHTTHNAISESRLIVPPNTFCSIHTTQNVITGSRFIIPPNTVGSIQITQNIIPKSRYYCTSKHSLLHSHNTIYHYKVPLLLYLNLQSTLFTQHNMSFKCLAIILPPNTVCTIHTTKTSLDCLAIIVPPNTICSIHTSQNLITVSSYYFTSKHRLLHSQNTKRHNIVSLLLYLQTQSAPFTQHKISLQCPSIIVPPYTFCSIHTI